MEQQVPLEVLVTPEFRALKALEGSLVRRDQLASRVLKGCMVPRVNRGCKDCKVLLAVQVKKETKA
jgi:hypothetical protein